MRVRCYDPDDFHALHAINEDNVPAVGTLSMDHFAWLLAQARASLVAEVDGRTAGFVLTMVQGSSYTSPNYRWFAERHDRFAYVDRIAVDITHRGKGVGGALYQALIDELTGQADGPPVLTCEVNTRPANPGSLRFHKRLGFAEVGSLVSHNGQKAVALLERPLDKQAP